MFLGATSTFKADSDLAKYEKARKLKDIISEVRHADDAGVMPMMRGLFSVRPV